MYGCLNIGSSSNDLLISATYALEPYNNFIYAMTVNWT